MSWYCKNYSITELKKEDDLDEIINVYKEKKNYDIDNSDIIYLNDSDINLKKKLSDWSSNYSINFISDSSKSDSSDIINIENKINVNKNNSSSDSDNKKAINLIIEEIKIMLLNLAKE